MDAKSKMTAARTALVLDEPFFGALALGLTLKADPTQATAWVDGRTLGYNPAFVDSLTSAQLKALVAHEVMHCANGHPWRRDGRDAKLWNIAADRAINGVLVESGFTLPDNAEMPQGDQVGKSAEWIYSRLAAAQPKPQPQQSSPPDANSSPDQQADADSPQDTPADAPQGDSSDPTGKPQPDPLGEVRDAPQETDADGEPAPTEQDWKERTQQAAQAARARGDMPAAAGRFAAETVRPRVDWKSALRRFVSETSKADYSWTRPNARYISRGLYLPALRAEAMGELAVAVDTSGSIDAVALANAQAELQAIIDETQPTAVNVFYCDARLHKVDRFEQGEPLVFSPVGGGGTDFRPVFEAIAEADEPPACLVFITDLYGMFPTDAPDVPTLWLTDTTLIDPPFGEVLPMA